eukprot:g27430.t1
MADWDNYQKMFKEQGCEREYVKYPYTRDMIEGYFKEYCAMTGLSVSADGPAPNAPPLTDCLETVLGALPAWAEDKRNLEGMDQNLLKDHFTDSCRCLNARLLCSMAACGIPFRQ